MMDTQFNGKPSIVGAINGMIAGLVGITPAAGYVNGWGALIIGVCAGIIPWLSLNKLQTSALMNKVDDTLSVFSTHGVAGLMGGLLTGVLANPDMLLYIGTDKDAPGINATGWYYGNFDQLKWQAIAEGERPSSRVSRPPRIARPGVIFWRTENHKPCADPLHKAASGG
jgi:Amt family ammonium transporter